MSTLSIQLPDSLHRRLLRFVRQDEISLDQFIVLAVTERISALTAERYLRYLRNRTSRDERIKYDISGIYRDTVMSTLNIQLPDSLYGSLQEFAERHGVSLDQFIALAVAEKISALTTEGYLQERANRGERAKYEAVLAKVADAEPEPYDRLP